MACDLDYGWNMLGLSLPPDPDLSSSKTSPDSIIVGLNGFSVILPHAGMLRNGIFCPLFPLAPRKLVTGSLFLPTPTASDHKGQSSPEQRRGTLSNFVELIPAWVPCECQNYLCTIHGKHAHDCDCPPIEEWSVDPYGPGRHGRLNPQFCEWLMGFPIGWTDLEPSETPSFLK